MLALILVAAVIGCVFIGAGRGLIYGIYSVIKNIVIIAAAIGIAPVIAKQLPSEVAVKEGIGYVLSLIHI